VNAVVFDFGMSWPHGCFVFKVHFLKWSNFQFL